MTQDIFSIQVDLSEAFRKSIAKIGAEDCPVTLERPKDPSHGDFATPVAMTLAKKLKKSPMVIAQELLKNIQLDPALVAEAVAMPPGFINLRLKPEAFYHLLESALAQDQQYGQSSGLKNWKVLLEFVSANPTGPLNVVNARAAVLGDAMARIIRTAGGSVDTEYFINDAGNQARLFGESLEAAVSRVSGVPKDAPPEGYQGAYMEDLAREYISIGGKETPASMDFKTACVKMGEWGMDRVVQWHKDSLEKYGVHFNRWFSERRELRESGLVDKTIQRLKGDGLTYALDGAVWFKVSEFGAPKDEVLVKSDGQPAYFTPDIAYHLNKYERGYNQVVDILGPDHHGHIQRLKAAVTALKLPVEKLTVLTAQQVNLLSGGEKVKMSKREGKFVTMEELLGDVGKDAARFFFVMRGANTHLDFDLEVAKKKTDENPVFYVQYAHARICSLLRKCAEKGFTPVHRAADFSPLVEPEAFLLLKEIMEYPQWVLDSGRSYEPHRIVIYLQGLAASFHLFYAKHRILDAAPEVAKARLGLALAVKNIVRNALDLLGVSAPEQM